MGRFVGLGVGENEGLAVGVRLGDPDGDFVGLIDGCNDSKWKESKQK